MSTADYLEAIIATLHSEGPRGADIQMEQFLNEKLLTREDLREALNSPLYKEGDVQTQTYLEAITGNYSKELNKIIRSLRLGKKIDVNHLNVLLDPDYYAYLALYRVPMDDLTRLEKADALDILEAILRAKSEFQDYEQVRGEVERMYRELGTIQDTTRDTQQREVAKGLLSVVESFRSELTERFSPVSPYTPTRRGAGKRAAGQDVIAEITNTLKGEGWAEAQELAHHYLDEGVLIPGDFQEAFDKAFSSKKDVDTKILLHSLTNRTNGRMTSLFREAMDKIIEAPRRVQEFLIDLDYLDYLLQDEYDLAMYLFSMDKLVRMPPDLARTILDAAVKAKLKFSTESLVKGQLKIIPQQLAAIQQKSADVQQSQLAGELLKAFESKVGGPRPPKPVAQVPPSRGIRTVSRKSTPSKKITPGKETVPSKRVVGKAITPGKEKVTPPVRPPKVSRVRGRPTKKVEVSHIRVSSKGSETERRLGTLLRQYKEHEQQTKLAMALFPGEL